MKKLFKIVFFLLVTVMAMYGFAKFTGANIVNSTINSTTIGATTPSTVAATTLTSSTSAQFNGSVLNTGTGFKHARANGCTTTTGAGTGFCTATLTWPAPAFADTNYTYGCSVEGNGAIEFTNVVAGSKTTSSIQYTLLNTPGNGSAATGVIECWAFHD